MLVFCFHIVFTLTYIRAQKAFQVKVTEGIEWNRPENFSTNTSGGSESFEKQSQKQERSFGPLITVNHQEGNEKFTNVGLDKNQNQVDDRKYITPRLFHARAQLDGGVVIKGKRNSLSEYKADLFENSSTNIPLIETFRDQFLQHQSKSDKTINRQDLTQDDATTKTDTTEDLSKNSKHKIEKDMGTKPPSDPRIKISQPSDSFNYSKYNNYLSHQSKQSNLIIVTPSSNDNKISLSFISNLTQNQPRGIHQDIASSNTANFDQTTLEPASKSEVLNISAKSRVRDSESNIKGNTKYEDKMINRFQKQILIRPNEKPSQAFSLGRSDSSQIQSARYNHQYSGPSLELQEPLNSFPTSLQKIGYYYPQRKEPMKTYYAPNYSQNFKPSSFDQNPYLSDRPPQEFETFSKPTQQKNPYYGPPLQDYHRWKNNSLSEIPTQNYKYPSYSYQPGEIIPPTEQTIELTTQSYQLSGEEAYQNSASLYQYGMPESIQQTYGPPGQQTYGPPSHQTYGPPSQQTYSPPSHQTYGPPSQQIYGPPIQQTYGPPEEFLPIQALRPYYPGSYSKIVLSDDQCVMSHKILAEALIEVAVRLENQGDKPRNCALMFNSNNNIAVSTMIQDDRNTTTNDLVKQMNFRIFTIQSTGHVLEVKNPWYLEDKSPGLALGQSNKIVITLQPNMSLTFRLLITSYKDTQPQIPVIYTFLLTANGTASLNETELMDNITKSNAADGKGNLSSVNLQTLRNQLFFVENPR